jgi:hypothetical protein
MDDAMALLCPLCGSASCPRRGWCRPVTSAAFTCPRCGRVSHNLGDTAQGYCGSCHDWTGDTAAASVHEAERQYPLRDQQGELELTPRVLLTDPRWSYAGEDAETVRFRYHARAGPWVASWWPDLSLGPCTVELARGEHLEIRLPKETMARAVMELIPLDTSRAWSWPELARYAGLLPAVLYRCGACGHQMEVSPGRRGLVLCGRHEHEYRPALHIMSPVQNRARETTGEDADPLAGLRAFIAETGGEPLTAWQARVLEQLIQADNGVATNQQVRAGLHTGDSFAARRARRLSRAENRPVRAGLHTGDSFAARDRRNRLLDEAEALIARLDGEGYGVRAKANRAEAETLQVRPSEAGAGADSAGWSPVFGPEPPPP